MAVTVNVMRPKDAGFVCYFHFVGWDCLSLGFHVCLSAPNIEIHVPFGFLRIGWRRRPFGTVVKNLDGRILFSSSRCRTFGIGS